VLWAKWAINRGAVAVAPELIREVVLIGKYLIDRILLIKKPAIA